MANKLKAGFDGPNKQFVLQMVDAATGAIVASWGNVTLELGQVPMGTPDDPGTTMGKTIKLRETRGCDPTTGADRFCMMPRSEWYTTPLTLHPDT